MDREKLKNLILYILNETGEISKVKLAKLLLFTEIFHFNKTNQSITGLYFVRLKMGPVIAFFDEVLEENIEKLWKKEIKHIPIYEEGREKAQHLFSAIEKKETPEEIKNTIKKIVRSYGKKSGTELSRLSHNLPAWKYSEPNEPIYIAELAVKDEKEYFALIDVLEGAEEDDAILAKKIPSTL